MNEEAAMRIQEAELALESAINCHKRGMWHLMAGNADEAVKSYSNAVYHLNGVKLIGQALAKEKRNNAA